MNEQPCRTLSYLQKVFPELEWKADNKKQKPPSWGPDYGPAVKYTANVGTSGVLTVKHKVANEHGSGHGGVSFCAAKTEDARKTFRFAWNYKHGADDEKLYSARKKISIYFGESVFTRAVAPAQEMVTIPKVEYLRLLEYERYAVGK